jgi:hypothetical protein
MQEHQDKAIAEQVTVLPWHSQLAVAVVLEVLHLALDHLQTLVMVELVLILIQHGLLLHLLESQVIMLAVAVAVTGRFRVQQEQELTAAVTVLILSALTARTVQPTQAQAAVAQALLYILESQLAVTAAQELLL